MSHSLLLCAKTPSRSFSLAFLNRYTQGCVSERWKTLNLTFPNQAEQQVILMLMLPVTSLELLMMSLVMLCAAPGWLKKGLTSYRQSPITFSPSFSSNTSLEGSSGTSIRKTSLTDVPEGAAAVLHLAICPSDTWQARGASISGALKFSMRMQRYPLRCGCVWADCMFKLYAYWHHTSTILSWKDNTVQHQGRPSAQTSPFRALKRRTKSYIIVLPSEVYTESSLRKEAIHFSQRWVDFWILLRITSNSLFLGFYRSFSSIAACWSYNYSISALRALVLRMASRQLSINEEIYSNSWLSSLKARTQFCYAVILLRCGCPERTDSSWTSVTSSQDRPITAEISLVTLMRSSTSRSNTFSSLSSSGALLNSHLRSRAPTSRPQTVLVMSSTECVIFFNPSRAVLCSLNSPLLQEKSNSWSKRKCLNSEHSRTFPCDNNFYKYRCSSRVLTSANSCVSMFKVARKFFCGSRGKTHPPQLASSWCCRNSKSLKRRLTWLAERGFCSCLLQMRQSLQLVSSPYFMSSGRSTSTVLPSRKASYSFYYWLRRASSYGSTPICILSISLLVLSCDYRVSLLLEDGRRWSFEAIATSWLLIVPSAVYYKKEYAMMGYSQSRWNGWNMGRSMRVCCEEIDSVNYHI